MITNIVIFNFDELIFDVWILYCIHVGVVKMKLWRCPLEKSGPSNKLCITTLGSITLPWLRILDAPPPPICQPLDQTSTSAPRRRYGRWHCLEPFGGWQLLHEIQKSILEPRRICIKAKFKKFWNKFLWIQLHILCVYKLVSWSFDILYDQCKKR